MSRARTRGAVTVEFALGLILLLMFLFAVLDFGRLLFTWNAASEASRLGARYAVVCDDTGQEALVLARMQALVPEIAAVDVAWSPAGCDPTSCLGVAVSITGLQFRWISPLAGLGAKAPIPMQGLRAYLPREVMRQDPNSTAICSSP